MNTKYAFFITFLAGISTLFGVIPIYFKINKNTIINVFKLSFLILTIISIGELIPDGFNLILRHLNVYLSFIILTITFFIGFLLTKLMDNKIGEGTDEFYRIGLIAMFAMIMHNIPEGIITYITANNDLKLGTLIAISIMFHNIPEGLLISLPIYQSKKRRGLALLLTLLSGMSEFLGAILSYLFLSKYITDFILGIIYIFTAGIMIYVALYELLPVIIKNMKNKPAQICIDNIIDE